MKLDFTFPKYLALAYLAVVIGVLTTVSVFLGLGWTGGRFTPRKCYRAPDGADSVTAAAGLEPPMLCPKP